MLYGLYALGITIIVAFFACIVPFIQFLSVKIKEKDTSKDKTVKYLFSKELFDAKLEGLFENSIYPSRSFVGARGWIRGPYGEVMTSSDLEEKKKQEYKNALP